MISSLYPAQDLRRRVYAWALKLKVNPRLVRIQPMTRKWGSCTSGGTVTLARDLLDQSVKFQDFVVVHELLHLRFSSHGRVFKAILAAHVPGWRSLDTQRHQPARRPMTPEGRE